MNNIAEHEESFLQGICPRCNHSQAKIISNTIPGTIGFECRKCKLEYYEFYEFKYIKTIHSLNQPDFCEIKEYLHGIKE